MLQDHGSGLSFPVPQAPRGAHATPVAIWLAIAVAMKTRGNGGGGGNNKYPEAQLGESSYPLELVAHERGPNLF